MFYSSFFKLTQSIVVLLLWLFGASLGYADSSKTLHLFSWWGMFPPTILEKFEKETGIKVINDLMESNEVLDAKLSAGRTGYDLVTPSFLPFGVRQVQSGLYQPLDLDRLPHWKGLDPDLLQRMAVADPGNRYVIPVVWGTVGLSYNIKKIQENLPLAPLTSWRLLFDPKIVKHFAGCRVTLLEEPYDLLVPALLGWGLSAQFSIPLLQEVEKGLRQIRPFISHFDSIRSANDLIEGNVCLIMQWTGGVEHARALSAKPSQHDDIKTIIPDEGSVMWIDTIMIPIDAPHPHEAHLFINFILRPDVMAAITNQTHYANPVPASIPLINETIRSHPAIYPPPNVMKKIHLNTLEPPSVTRLVNRLMTNFRRGK